MISALNGAVRLFSCKGEFKETIRPFMAHQYSVRYGLGPFDWEQHFPTLGLCLSHC